MLCIYTRFNLGKGQPLLLEILRRSFDQGEFDFDRGTACLPGAYRDATAGAFDTLDHAANPVVSLRAGASHIAILVPLAQIGRQAHAVIGDAQHYVAIQAADVKQDLLSVRMFLDVGERLLPDFPERLFDSFRQGIDIGVKIVLDLQPSSYSHFTRVAADGAACGFALQRG